MKFGFNRCVPVSTPADPNIRFDQTGEPLTDPPFNFMSAEGSLMYAHTLSRPDISYAVSMIIYSSFVDAMDLLLEIKILSCDKILIPVYSECVCIFLTNYFNFNNKCSKYFSFSNSLN